MSLGLIGRKVGMTRIFTDEGVSTPVTVVDVGHNRVAQIKTVAKDGYDALQIAFGQQKASRISKPAAGHFAKANIEAAQKIAEFRVPSETIANYQPGTPIDVSLFKVGDKVDVSGTSLGKGFSGGIKRHNFSSNRASHGNSVSHNKPGSIGQNQDPGRVFPGKRMAGHLGAVQKTIQSLKVIKTDESRQLLYVKGGIPGSDGQIVTIHPAVKGAK